MTEEKNLQIANARTPNPFIITADYKGSKTVKTHYIVVKFMIKDNKAAIFL